MKKIIVTINNEDVKNIQKLSHEMNALKSVICQMIENDRNIDTKAFLDYHNSYIEANAKYEIAKSNIEKKYVLENPDVKACGNKVNWDLEYSTGELTITPLGEIYNACDCTR